MLTIPTISAKTNLELEPSTLDISSKEKTFNISLIVSPDVEIDTVATDLITWDKDIIECVSISKGDLFEDDLIWIPGTITKNGTIEMMAWGSQIPTNAKGTFVELEFRAVGRGETDIVVDSDNYGVARIGEPIERDIINNCHIVSTVAGSSNPDNPKPTVVDDNFQIPYVAIAIIAAIIIVIVAVYFVFRRSERVESDKSEDDLFAS